MYHRIRSASTSGSYGRPEDVLFPEGPTQQDYDVACGWWDHWQDRAMAAEARLAAMQSPDRTTCMVPNCGRRVTRESTFALCNYHWAEIGYEWLRSSEERRAVREAISPSIDPYRDCVVYYIDSGDRVKIGTTTNLKHRLKRILSVEGCPARRGTGKL